MAQERVEELDGVALFAGAWDNVAFDDCADIGGTHTPFADVRVSAA